MVISTGTTCPTRSSVAALYCLTNSIVWTPWGPRAVPTGGAGVALPAGSWILTMAVTRRLAIGGEFPFLELRHMGEVELDGRLAPEDVDQHLELQLVFVDLGDRAAEVGEGPLADPHRLAQLVL